MGDFYCKVCKRDGKFEVSWIHHITSLGHQRTLARLPQGGCGSWEEDEDIKCRAVEVVGCKELHAKPVDIAQFLTKTGGTIEEFICPTSLNGTKPEVISCLFKTAEAVRELIYTNHPKQLCRQELKIRRKYERDWNSEGNDPPGPGKTEENNEEESRAELENENGIEHSPDNGTPSSPPQSAPPKEVTEPRRVFKEEKPPPVKWKTLPLEAQLQELEKLQKNDVRRKIGAEMQRIFATVFNNCLVYSYGPDFVGLALESDEVRFCVDPYGKFASKDTIVVIRNSADPLACGLVFQILSTFKRSDGSPQFLFASQYSTHPTLDIPEMSFKFAYKEDLIPCKLQFENFVSVQKAKLLKFFCQHDPRVWPLLSLIKLWSRRQKVLHQLREGEEFDAYILVALMLFHLTRLKIIPTVTSLRELDGTRRLVLDNTEISFCTDRKKVPATHLPGMSDKLGRALSILSTLEDFFDFFATLDFREYVICPSIGMEVNRKLFRPNFEDQIPKEMIKYYRCNADGSAREQKLMTCTPVCIQDVLDLTDNIARAMDDSDIALFQKKCAESAKFLNRILRKAQGNLNTIFGVELECEDAPETDSEEDNESNGSVSLSEPLAIPQPPEDPPLAPPPLPFNMPGMPSIPVSFSPPRSGKRPGLVPPPPPPPKIGRLQIPPPPKMGSLSSTPRSSTSSSSPARAYSSQDSPVRIARDPEGNKSLNGESRTDDHDRQRSPHLNGGTHSRFPAQESRRRRRPSSESIGDTRKRDRSATRSSPIIDKEPVMRISRDPRGEMETNNEPEQDYSSYRSYRHHRRTERSETKKSNNRYSSNSNGDGKAN